MDGKGDVRPWASRLARHTLVPVPTIFVRPLTFYLVRQGTLDDYVHLAHGAHYAIGALAVILMVTIQYEINEVITGLVGSS